MMPVSRPPSASRAPGRRSGLRERKKLAVRQALGSAALRLTVERGPENVTVEDITAEADVSLRTFGNYFSSKYEAICAIGTEALAEAIAARTGTDLEQDMYPRILAGAVIAAAQVAVRQWSVADPPVPLGPLLRRALEQLATACPRDAGRR
jgi:AcrR family transcriptional regulator